MNDSFYDRFSTIPLAEAPARQLANAGEESVRSGSPASVETDRHSFTAVANDAQDPTEAALNVVFASATIFAEAVIDATSIDRVAQLQQRLQSVITVLTNVLDASGRHADALVKRLK